MNSPEPERAAPPPIKSWYKNWILWVVVLLGAGVFFGWPRIKGRYLRWSASNQVQRAEKLLVEKDYKRAVMTARAVLDVEPTHIGATRILAKALEAIGAPEAAQWRSQLDTLDPGNQENILAWAAALMKTGDLPATERVLGMLRPESREDASYHALAARLANSKQDKAAAEKHLAEAVRLDPGQDEYRLFLATLRIQSSDSALRAEAMGMLTALGEKTPKNVGAIRVLLNHALGMEDWKTAEALSKSLATDPSATFGDKLLRLSTIRKMNTQEAPGFMIELRNEALSKPGELYTLLMWMNENQLSMLVSEWVRTMPQDIVGAPPVCVAVADGYARSSEWQRLRAFLDDHSWSDLDYLRLAFLSRAHEKLGEAETSANEWKDSLAAVRGKPDFRDRLERLARVAISWGWDQRAEEILWALSPMPGCPRWVLDALWRVAAKRANTGQLQKLAALRAKADPKSVLFRTEYAFFSLLMRSEDGNSHREAERLFRENPGDAGIARTHALSLYQQGKIAEALGVTSGLHPEERKAPHTALYHAIFLIASGENAKAAEFLAEAERRTMFPEEITLLKLSKLEAGKAAEESSVAETTKAMRAAKAAREAAEEKEVAEATKAARAAKAAKEAAEEKEIAEATKAARAARAAMDAEKEKAVEEARAARAAKAAKEAAEPAAKDAPLLRLTPK